MNEIEKKEIKEIAHMLCKLNCKCCESCYHLRVATELYNAGYRNCKDKVVLSREEYARLRNLEINYEDTYENYREYAIENNKLKEELRQASELKAETIKLTKQYGVEVE